MIEKKRVLHVVGAMNRAGTETMLMNIYRNINKEVVQFDFISYSQQDAHYDKEINILGGRVIRLSNPQSIKELYTAIKTYGPYEAVHSHTLFHCGISNFAGMLAGIKVRIAHAHTTLDRSDSILRKLYIKSMRFMINSFSTHLLACSQEAARYLFGTVSLGKPKYSYFPNLIDYTSFLSAGGQKVKSFKGEEELDNSLVIGHIGRFMDAKNHAFLLEILKCLIQKGQNIRLLLVGDGELKNPIQEAAEKNGLTSYVRFVGVREDIPTMLHSMDVFVFPSIYEGLGLVLLEAQASGLPCVVSEAIQPEANLDIGLFNKLSLSEGPEAWANKILEVIGKKERNEQVIESAFHENGYVLSTGISKLRTIYCV